MNINTFIVTGYLTRGAEVRKTTKGSSVTVFGLAYNEWYRGEDRGVSFFDIEIWGRYGEVMADWLTKGTKVTVHGRIRQQRWTSNSGERRSKHVVIANNIETHTTTREGDAPDEPVSTPATEQSVDGAVDADAESQSADAEVDPPARKRRSTRRQAA